MKDIVKDIKFGALILVANTLLQVLSDGKASLGVKLAVGIMAIIMGCVTYVSMRKEDNKKVQYGFVIYSVVFIVAVISLAAVGITNIINIVNGITWSITVAAYILSLSHPVLTVAMLLLSFVTQVIIESVIGGHAESFNGLIIISVIALLVYCVYANKRLEKNISAKEHIKGIILCERKPLKVKMWTQVVIWSLIITSMIYIAKTQLYERMNSEFNYALFAAASVTIPTLLIIGALSTSVFIVELYMVYVLLEIYTLSYLVFLDTGSLHIEISTVLVDIAVLIYIVQKYKRLTKEHVVQIENNKN